MNAGLSGGVFVALWLMLTVATSGWVTNPAAAFLVSLLAAVALLIGYRFNHSPARWVRVLKGVIVGVGCLLALPVLMRGDLLNGMLLFVLFVMLGLSCTLTSRRELFMLILASIGLILYASTYSRHFELLLSLYLLSVVGVLMQMQQARVRQQAAQYRGRGSALAVLPVTLSILILSALIYWLLPQPEPTYKSLIPQDAEFTYSNRSWETMADQQERGAGGQSGSGTGSGSGQGTGRGGQSPSPALASEPVLGAVGQQDDQPPRLLLRVDSESRPLLQTLVFDHFNGQIWSRGSAAGDRFYRLHNGVFERPGPSGFTAQVQSIEVIEEMPAVLPVSPVALRVELPARVIRADGQSNLYLPGALQPGLHYRVESVLGRVDGHRLTPDALGTAQWLQLPDSALGLCPLSDQLVAGRTPLAAGREIERYLLEQRPASTGAGNRAATLSLQPEQLQSGGLTAMQRITAFALMLRCQSIPSRVVSGFRGDTQHPISGTWEISSDDAVVWAELYLPERGWLQFAVNDEPGTLARSWLEQTLEYVEQRLQRADTGLMETLLLSMIAVLLAGLILLAQLPLWIKLILGLVVLLVLGLLLWAWWQRESLRDHWLERRFRRRLRQSPELAATHLLAALESWLSRRGQGRVRHETASLWLRRVCSDHPWLAEALAPVEAGFNRDRYAACGTSMSPAQAQTCWRAFRKCIAQQGWQLGES
ncbi:transglutaminase TgpA family protein [Marinobacterium sp. YM272]|uniref:transglutaminase TgpA family protein n=1 Tax=Marinobacterium sp. YM272 TaxID=3421654 RepID=UPI003D7FA26F